MDKETESRVQLWKENVTEPDLKAELDELISSGDEEALNDAFYRDLAFGTAGLRGTLGVGTNRMNVYVVAQATQGVADYLNAHYENPSIALARDSRLKGEDFQRVAAGVLRSPSATCTPPRASSSRRRTTPRSTTATRSTTTTAARSRTRPLTRSPPPSRRRRSLAAPR